MKRIFKVFHDKYRGDDDPWLIPEFTHEDAAIAYGEYFDQGDYEIVNGENIRVRVESDSGISMEFVIGASQVVEYYAQEVKGARGRNRTSD